MFKTSMAINIVDGIRVAMTQTAVRIQAQYPLLTMTRPFRTAKLETMNTKTNPCFVGLIMAFFMPGSAHVLSGRWKTGIIWFCGFWVLSWLKIFVLSIPVVLSFSVVIALLILFSTFSVVYYVLLFVSSYRLDTPRLGYCGWFLFLLLSIIYHITA